MNCYEFETKISAFIDGELKHTERNQFTEHKKMCDKCVEKLTKIKTMLVNFAQITTHKTSTNFFHNLDKKIQAIENAKSPIWEKIIQFKPFGLEPVYAMGAACALGVLMISSYFLLNLEKQPEFNQDVISKSQSIPQKPRESSLPVILADDESENIDDSTFRYLDAQGSNQNILMVNSPN